MTVTFIEQLDPSDLQLISNNPPAHIGLETIISPWRRSLSAIGEFDVEHPTPTHIDLHVEPKEGGD